ncbi:cytidine deaminase-like [Lineus longissimus]|uniref:cytidine deaminase-like n=1 Tax=Lineus longissimus TaxID=88925 RepID=UPI002B4CEAFB
MDTVSGEVRGVSINSLDAKLKEICLKAIKAKENAHCPYSNYRVGSALLTTDGTIFVGCNVENASYPLCVCAERVVINNAVTSGYKKFSAMAISADSIGTVTGPCGACRQCIIEFGTDWDVYMVQHDLSWYKFKAGNMMPRPFMPSTLEEERIS